MKTIIALLFLVVSLKSVAQVPFISSGKIEFEKKINLEKERQYKPWLNRVGEKLPKYYTSQHLLYFSEGKTLYEKGTYADEKNAYYSNDENTNDIIYFDLRKNEMIKKQALFEETILISDSIRSIKWEMENDTREIAGFECHKATAVILDSIYVVAYYTDQITVTGGPLSYNNLPGMILGIAIPRMNLTIFATKVELLQPGSEKFSPPTAKQKLDYKDFIKLLQETTQKMREPERSRYVINSLL